MIGLTRRDFVAGIGASGGVRLWGAMPGSSLGDRPNLRFGVLSDLHVRVTKDDNGTSGGTETFEHALEYFRERAVDAVMIAGDLSDLGLGDELLYVAAAWRKVFPDNRAPDGRKVEKIFIIGNHEHHAFVYGQDAMRKIYHGDEKEVRRQLVMADPEGWWERAFDEPYERFGHKCVNGYDFLSAHWDGNVRITSEVSFEAMKKDLSLRRESFAENLQVWMGRYGHELDPRKPFFYQQHRSLWNTTYGDWAWNHDDGRVTKILSAYPNAVSFSGDTHYSLTDSRSVWQGAFTAFGTASLRYGGIPDESRAGAAYENGFCRPESCDGLDPQKTMQPYDSTKCRQGMVFSVYDDRMVVERRDFLCDRPLGDDLVVPLPVARSAKPYGFETRKAKARRLSFVRNAQLIVRRGKSKNRHGDKVDVLEIVIPPVEQTANDRCLEYAVTVYGKDGAKAEFNVLQNGFDRPITHPRALGPTIFSVAVNRLPLEMSRLEVVPLDCWWNRGEALTSRICSDSDPGVPLAAADRDGV